jgi:hypothetical protein
MQFLDYVQRRPNIEVGMATFAIVYSNLLQTALAASMTTYYTSRIFFLSHYFVYPLPHAKKTSLQLSESNIQFLWRCRALCQLLWPHDHDDEKYSCRLGLSSLVTKLEEPVVRLYLLVCLKMSLSPSDCLDTSDYTGD